MSWSWVRLILIFLLFSLIVWSDVADLDLVLAAALTRS
jgi:hypothetical protein